MSVETETNRIKGISIVSIQCIMIKWWGFTTGNLILKIHHHFRTLTKITKGNHSNLLAINTIPKFFLPSSHNKCNRILCLNLSRFHPSAQCSLSKDYLVSIKHPKTLKTRKVSSEVPIPSTTIESNDPLLSFLIMISMVIFDVCLSIERMDGIIEWLG